MIVSADKSTFAEKSQRMKSVVDSLLKCRYD